MGKLYFCTDSAVKLFLQIATQMLLELNPDVKGEYVEENACSLIESNSQYFLSFSVVIVCGICNETIRKLARVLWEANIPLFLCLSYGFVGELAKTKKRVLVLVTFV